MYGNPLRFRKNLAAKHAGAHPPQQKSRPTQKRAGRLLILLGNRTQKLLGCNHFDGSFALWRYEFAEQYSVSGRIFHAELQLVVSCGVFAVV